MVNITRFRSPSTHKILNRWNVYIKNWLKLNWSKWCYNQGRIMGSTIEQIEQKVIIRQLGVQPYDTIWHRMQQFTDQRTADTIDEIWLVQHPPVFTQGQAGKPEHILTKTNIPIVQSDRGGQVTYHGPGQQVMYILVDIKRRKAIDKLSGKESP